MFVPRGDRDLGLAYQTHPGNQASSQGEAKNSAVLLGRDGYLLEPTVCHKGSQASCGVWIEDSGFLSRPCRKRRAWGPPSSSIIKIQAWRDFQGPCLLASTAAGHEIHRVKTQGDK